MGNSSVENVPTYPADWVQKCLGEIAIIVTGRTPPTADSTNFGRDIPFVTPGDVGAKKYIDSSERSLSSTGAVQAREVPQDSVLFVCIGSTIGKVGFTKVPVTFNQQINALVCNSAILPEYLFYSLTSIAPEIREQASEQAVPLLNKSDFSQIKIFVPKLIEQEAIAKSLGDVDSLIDSLDALIAKKRDIKLGALQQLLTGKIRLPGFSGEWQPTSLSNLGICIRGVTYNPERDLRETDTSETSRLLRSNNVFGGRINTDSIQFVSTSRVAPPQVLREGDIVICMANGSRALVGKSAIFYAPRSIHQHTFGAFMGAFRCDDIQDCSYVSYLFQSKNYRNFLDVALSGSSINNLNPGQILEMVFTIPKVKERRAIAELLSDMDAEIDVLVARREKTALIKTGMMQELLTGRTRLL